MSLPLARVDGPDVALLRLGVAEAALALVGTRFVLGGRDPAIGLDCVGLVSVALARMGRGVHAPTGYGLRNRSIAHWLPLARKAGLVLCEEAAGAGDCLLTASGPAQHHLLIVGPDGSDAIHAHAGLRRVVVSPLPLADCILRHWRLH